MIELLYFASQIQCGPDSSLINVQVDVYHNQQLVHTLSVNDKVLLPVNSVEELTFEYSFINASCTPQPATEMVLGSQDYVPSLAGVYEQQSIQELLNGLNNYEELFLAELGTTDNTSTAFDLQDVVIKVNNNPTIIYAD